MQFFRYDKKNIIWAVIAVLVITGLFFYFIATEKGSERQEQVIEKISDERVVQARESLLRAHKNAKIMYQDIRRIWYNIPHGSEGCSYLSYYDVRKNDFVDTELSSCSRLDLSKTNPLYIEVCPSFVPCFDGQTLRAMNLMTAEEVILFDTALELEEWETLISRCAAGNYGLNCFYDITVNNDGLMRIGVYLEQKNKIEDADLRTPEEDYWNIDLRNEKIRDTFIDLKSFF